MIRNSADETDQFYFSVEQYGNMLQTLNSELAGTNMEELTLGGKRYLVIEKTKSSLIFLELGLNYCLVTI